MSEREKKNLRLIYDAERLLLVRELVQLVYEHTGSLSLTTMTGLDDKTEHDGLTHIGVDAFYLVQCILDGTQYQIFSTEQSALVSWLQKWFPDHWIHDYIVVTMKQTV